MVIIADKVGQLCNQLFRFSFFIANAIDNNYKLVNPYFAEYVSFFEETSTNKYLGYAISNKITRFKTLDKVVLKYYEQLAPVFPKLVSLDIRNCHTNYDLKNTDYLQIATKKVAFAKGWLFKDQENLRKHRKTLLEIFKPKAIYNEEASANISELREKFDCVIGVHIRRGDYRDWNEGKYFYSDVIYLDKMKQIEKEINSSGRSCCFFIASNESINVTSFITTNISYKERHFITDLYALASCDYVIGPPSTYSLWAAFYGNIPFLIIENENTEAKLNNFTYY